MKYLPAATKLGQGNKFTGVCLSTRGGGGEPGLVLGGVSEIFGGVCLKFWGGCVSEIFGGCLKFSGGCLKFSGGVPPNFFLFFSISFPPKKFLLGCTPPKTVNARPVRILLECFLVFYHLPNISCLKCTVNSNFHLIRSKILTNDFELTVPNL